jgi:nitrite reductase (cytochrome c-552)
MPYRREGGVKFTGHKIQSPLNNISGSCQICHRESEEPLRKNVYDIQDKVAEVRRIAEMNLFIAHIGAKIAWENNATEKEMEPILALIRSSQWRWDWVAAANGMGFHSPIEALRVLATSIQKSQEARLLLAEVLIAHHVKLPYQLPDISTKEKAQKLIGVDMEKIKADKETFKREVASKWPRAKY